MTESELEHTLPALSLGHVLISFTPVFVLLEVMRRWSLNITEGIYANLRMLLQLLAIGYVLIYLFETDQPLVVLAVLLLMLAAGTWISLQPLPRRTIRLLLIAFAGLGISGGATLVIVTQFVLDLPRWFEPRFVIPLAGMVFANAMNAMSLAAERFEVEMTRLSDWHEARATAMQAALIPQINTLLAVGLVALPGMMTGQILAGTDPLVAVRYQIMVMCMVFGSGGLAAATFLHLQCRYFQHQASGP